MLHRKTDFPFKSLGKISNKAHQRCNSDLTELKNLYLLLFSYHKWQMLLRRTHHNPSMTDILPLMYTLVDFACLLFARRYVYSVVGLMLTVLLTRNRIYFVAKDNHQCTILYRKKNDQV